MMHRSLWTCPKTGWDYRLDVLPVQSDLVSTADRDVYNGAYSYTTFDAVGIKDVNLKFEFEDYPLGLASSPEMRIKFDLNKIPSALRSVIMKKPTAILGNTRDIYYVATYRLFIKFNDNVVSGSNDYVHIFSGVQKHGISEGFEFKASEFEITATDCLRVALENVTIDDVVDSMGYTEELVLHDELWAYNGGGVSWSGLKVFDSAVVSADPTRYGLGGGIPLFKLAPLSVLRNTITTHVQNTIRRIIRDKFQTITLPSLVGETTFYRQEYALSGYPHVAATQLEESQIYYISHVSAAGTQTPRTGGMFGGEKTLWSEAKNNCWDLLRIWYAATGLRYIIENSTKISAYHFTGASVSITQDQFFYDSIEFESTPPQDTITVSIWDAVKDDIDNFRKISSGSANNGEEFSIVQIYGNQSCNTDNRTIGKRDSRITASGTFFSSTDFRSGNLYYYDRPKHPVDDGGGTYLANNYVFVRVHEAVYSIGFGTIITPPTYPVVRSLDASGMAAGEQQIGMAYAIANFYSNLLGGKSQCTISAELPIAEFCEIESGVGFWAWTDGIRKIINFDLTDFYSELSEYSSEFYLLSSEISVKDAKAKISLLSF